MLADIVLRQLGSSFGGTDEISGYVMAIATSWGMAFTLLELGHVRIDILRGRAGDLGRALFDLFAMLVLTGTVTGIKEFGAFIDLGGVEGMVSIDQVIEHVFGFCTPQERAVFSARVASIRERVAARAGAAASPR